VAIVYVGQTGAGVAAATPLVCTITTAPGAGSLVVARVAANAAVTGVTDTKGNTWTVDSASIGGVIASICSTGQDVGKLTVADTISFAATGATRVNAIVDEFTGLDVSVSRVDQVAHGGATLTARSGGTTAATTVANELVVGCFGVPGTEASFTPGGGWSAFTTGLVSASVATVEGEYQIVSATGTQNPTGTGATSATTGGATATYKIASVPATTTLHPSVPFMPNVSPLHA
jgi:hypothetical protein